MKRGGEEEERGNQEGQSYCVGLLERETPPPTASQVLGLQMYSTKPTPPPQEQFLRILDY